MRVKFSLLVLLQILLLCGMIAYRQYWIETGERVFLAVRPVDPRDLFRGDYVSLEYEISVLDLDKLSPGVSFRRGEKVYVVLAPGKDGTDEAARVSKTLPAGRKVIQGRAMFEKSDSPRWHVSLRDDAGNLHSLAPPWRSGFRRGDPLTFCLDSTGRVRNVYKMDLSGKNRCGPGPSLSGTVEDFQESKFRSLQVEYGIESFFVQEGRGREIESRRNAGEMKAEAVLRKDGKGMLKALWVDGKKFE
jgi:uncharacterized membrane-anchored protein